MRYQEFSILLRIDIWLTLDFFRRFPRSLPMVILDYLERLYLAGFVLLQAFISAFPFIVAKLTKTPSDELTREGGNPVTSDSKNTMEFLPLMLTSVYCAIGITWAFLRLSYIYMKPPSRS